MKSILLFLTMIIFAIAGCSQTASTKQNYQHEVVSTVSVEPPKTTHHPYIIFGLFCGECDRHCATMYRCNFAESANAANLFVDSTDSYFKNSGNVICNTQVHSFSAIQIAAEISRHIPAQLLNTDSLSQRFGCPDCTDGCGIFVEIGSLNKVKKFYIDLDTSNMTSEMKDFSKYMKSAIDSISGRK